jgi:predicted GNAT family N-acyltransferase
MQNLEISIIKERASLEHIRNIRMTVFVEEQNVPKKLEMDVFDEIDKAEHVLMKYEGKPIGCARIRFLAKKAKLERIAILKEYRGRGFGKALMEYMIDYCRKRGFKEIILHGQLRSREFYEKMGFRACGEIFMDAGIEHIEMYLTKS